MTTIPDDNKPGFYSIAQAAERLEMTPSGVLRAIQRGKLQGIRWYSIWLIPTRAIETYQKSKAGRPRSKGGTK